MDVSPSRPGLPLTAPFVGPSVWLAGLPLPWGQSRRGTTVAQVRLGNVDCQSTAVSRVWVASPPSSMQNGRRSSCTPGAGAQSAPDAVPQPARADVQCENVERRPAAPRIRVGGRQAMHGTVNMGLTQPLGRSDLLVPRLGVGAMTWGEAHGLARLHPAKIAYGGADGLDEERGALEASIAAGVTFFDTAAMYAGGASERR